VSNSTRRTNERADKHVVQHVVGLLASRPWVVRPATDETRTSCNVVGLQHFVYMSHDELKMADEADEQIFTLACSCVILSSVLLVMRYRSKEASRRVGARIPERPPKIWSV